MLAPLIAPAWRPRVAVTILAAVGVVVVLAAIAYHAGTTSFDTWMFRKLSRHIDAGAASTLLHFSDPVISYVVPSVVGVSAALLRRWDITALAVIAPLASLGLTELVLKPLIGRLLGPGVLVQDYTVAVTGSFPSGHETGIAASALVLFLAGCQLRLAGWVRAVAALVLTAWMVVAAIGLVRNFYHYATDTIGAVALCVATVLLVAAGIDWVVARVGLSSPDARTPARTSHAA